MKLRSPAFSDHTLIPARYSHQGGDVSPPLQWSEVPDGTNPLPFAGDERPELLSALGAAKGPYRLQVGSLTDVAADAEYTARVAELGFLRCESAIHDALSAMYARASSTPTATT